MTLPSSTLEWILILFGIAPVLIAMLCKLVVTYSFGKLTFDMAPFQKADNWYNIPSEVPWKHIGDSAIRSLPQVATRTSATADPRFTSLRCSVYQIGKAKWKLSIEFVIENQSSNHELVIDDIHARMFEADAYQPPYATISRFGDVWLMQDNRILKENRSYSLAPGDGYEINLLFEATRVEGAPAYGWDEPTEMEGAVHIVFGLLVDYYFITPNGIQRGVVPSDRIYLFGYPQGITGIRGRELDSVDDGSVQRMKVRATNEKQKAFVARLEKYVSEHAAFSAEPTA